MKTIIRFILFFSLNFSFFKSTAQIIVSTQVTANATNVILNSFLAPSGVSGIQNVTFSGVPGSFATFTGTSNIGFNDGIILSSDNANQIANPASAQLEGPSYWSQFWDPQLQSLIGLATPNDSIRDAAVLQFDFQPLTDTIRFRYVFGSEEYPEYVCAFNDVFGCFISGPNPSGGNYANYNFALIPDTTLPVSINSVNPGVPGAASAGGTCSLPGQSLAYSSLYTNNSSGTTIIFDGFTHVLEAKVAVKICGTYHIKLGVANARDEVYNSAIFLEEHSFGGNYVPLTSSGGTTIGNDSTLICVGDTVTLCAANSIHYQWGTNGPYTQCIQVTQPGTYHCFVNDPAFTCFQISEDHYVLIDPNCFVGLNDLSNTDLFTISPNPFSDEVTIHPNEKFINEAVISILSLTGEELKGIQIKQSCNDYKVSLKELPSGIYFLRLTSETETMTKKIVRK